MKSLLAAMLVAGAFAMPTTVCQAEEVSRDRGAEATQVASFFGLEEDTYRVLDTQQADAVRGTGGLLGLPRLGLRAGISANANVRVSKLLNARVRARVGASVRVGRRGYR